jgi:hypothetical protein
MAPILPAEPRSLIFEPRIPSIRPEMYADRPEGLACLGDLGDEGPGHDSGREGAQEEALSAVRVTDRRRSGALQCEVLGGDDREQILAAGGRQVLYRWRSSGPTLTARDAIDRRPGPVVPQAA